jgi:ABC-type glutathione transport system ATPase component
MLLEVRDIQKTFSGTDGAGGRRGASIHAVNGVSFSLFSGESLGIVGESGCGKTTLAKIILGLVPMDAGQILFEGRAVWGDRERERHFRRSVRVVFQDPFASLDPRFSVRQVLREALCLEPRLSCAQQEDRMRAVLKSVRLGGDILLRYPHEFSGGERQRIAIARALMTSPSVVVLDEAVSSLDLVVQGEVLGLLADLHKATGVTYLFISHNLRAVKRLCPRVAVMCQGVFVETGSLVDIFEDARHPYTRALLSAALSYQAPTESEGAVPMGSGLLRDVASGHWVRE